MRVFSGGDEQSRISLELCRTGDEGTITNFLFSEGLRRRLATREKKQVYSHNAILRLSGFN